MQPFWPHDCRACLMIAKVQKDNITYDIYRCDSHQGEQGTTQWVLRFDEPQDALIVMDETILTHGTRASDHLRQHPITFPFRLLWTFAAQHLLDRYRAELLYLPNPLVPRKRAKG